MYALIFFSNSKQYNLKNNKSCVKETKTLKIYQQITIKNVKLKSRVENIIMTKYTNTVIIKKT